MEKRALVHLFHILIIGSLFLYVGIQKTNIPTLLFPLLTGLGMTIIIYHAYKIYAKLVKDSHVFWVNLIHIFIVGPILINIGINKDKTEKVYFELLLMLGFASIGYHGYYLASTTE
jgi:Na+-transporting methylmalonyl-CoA/oxaloacetate decarboxylase beta subunit